MALETTQDKGGTFYEHPADAPRLWLTADRQAVVEEGDTRAAFLLIAPGQTMPRAEAKRYGLGEQGAKGKAAPANKAKAAPENKAKSE